MRQALICLGLVLSLGVCAARADEQTRLVQEELRKRNLYFGDIDGRVTPELAHALRRYQSRKGFAETGTIDVETARSLHVVVSVGVAAAEPAASPPLPDVPVLRSDAALELSDERKTALEETSGGDPPASPAAPAEQPNPAQNLAPEQIKKFVESYLRDAESDDIGRQVQYYADNVQYFDQGRVDRAFIAKDTRNYCARWTTRDYTLIGPVTFAAAEDPDATVVDFTIAYSVKNKQHTASGKTRNTWTIKPEGDELKIIGIREERLRR